MGPIENILEEKGRTLHVIAPDANVLEAVDTMCNVHVGALLVMEDQTLVGVFSERDLMTRIVLTGLDPARTLVGDVMTRYVISVSTDATPHDVMTLMTNHRVRHVPVVEGHRVVGLVSVGDLVRWTIHDQSHTIAQLEDYVTGRYPG
jgi:CBS domain-containing protein